MITYSVRFSTAVRLQHFVSVTLPICGHLQFMWGCNFETLPLKTKCCSIYFPRFCQYLLMQPSGITACKKATLISHQISGLPSRMVSIVLLGIWILLMRQSVHIYMNLGKKLRTWIKPWMLVTFGVREDVCRNET